MLAIAVQECAKRLQTRLGRGYAFVPWSLCDVEGAKRLRIVILTGRSASGEVTGESSKGLGAAKPARPAVYSSSIILGALNRQPIKLSYCQFGLSLRCSILLSVNGNGRQDARSCFARRTGAHLRILCLERWPHCLGFGLFCSRPGRASRRGPEALALNFTATMTAANAPRCPWRVRWHETRGRVAGFWRHAA
jgi:hypothetical protein